MGFGSVLGKISSKVLEPVGGLVGGVVGGIQGPEPGLKTNAVGPANQSADRLRNDFKQAMEMKYGAPQFATPQLGGQAGNAYSSHALNLSQQAAMGNAPSAAAIQQQQGLQQALQGQLASANSVRGGAGNQLAASLNAQNQGALMQQNGINNAAMLRAQEMAAARGEFANAGFQQAGLEQQRNLAQLYAQQQANQLAQQGELATNAMNQQQQLAGLSGLSDAERLRLSGYLGQMNAEAGLSGQHSAARGQIIGGLFSGAGAALGHGASQGDDKKKG